MIVTMKSILDKAKKGNYAVPAFNTNNMEITQAIIRAAEKMKSPVIIQTSEGAIEYAGLEYLYEIIRVAARNSKVPVAIHLDHGRDMKVIKKCIEIGYTSVMFDGSHYDYEKNIKLTKKVVSWAKKRNVSVEAELGTIGGAEDKVSSRKIQYTNPEDARDFVRKTRVDALAVAIGTSHGAYKFDGEAKLDIERLKEIRRKVNIPLVLHGASGVPKEVMIKARKTGAKLGKAEGVPDSQLREAVKNGINKVNTDTDLRLAFNTAVRDFIIKNPEVFDPRKILAPARDYMQKIAEHRIVVCGSNQKA